MASTQVSELPRVDAVSSTSGAPSSQIQVTWLVPLSVLVVGMFMAVLDATIVNVALPRIQGDLGADTEDVLWVATAYTLTLGVVVPLSGWLGDRFGLKRVYITTLIAFSAGSALCGVAWDLNSLIGFRILQAIPGGILPVISLTILNVIVPPEKIGAAMGLYGLGIVVAPAVGPVLGGYLVDNFHWSLIFYINVPIGLAGALGAYFVLKGRIGNIVRRPFDVAGFACIAPALFAILLACSKGEDWGWTSYGILMLLTFGALSLALFAVVELQVEHPLLDVRVFGCWPFVCCMILLVVVTCGLLGGLYYLPVFMQLGQGLTALEAGMRILPQACVIAVLMPIAGRIYDKVGPRPLAVAGFSIGAYGNYLLHDLTPDVTHADIVWWTCVRGIGMGVGMMPVMTCGIAALGPARVNAGSAWTMVVRQTSGAIPLAILSAIATGQQSQLMSDRAAVLTPEALLANGVVLPDGHTAESLYGVAGVFRQVQLQVLASSYADVFLITAVLSAFAALLALTLPGRPPSRAAPADPAAAESTAAEPAAAPEPAAAEPAAAPEPAAAEPAAAPEPAAPELPATPAQPPKRGIPVASGGGG